jgi:NAD(P)-dependent dehydrogenase (short-subunit alcohol dehydrogenase family)
VADATLDDPMSVTHDIYRLVLGPSWSRAAPARLEAAVDGRVVLVTGASSGIGAGTAELLAGAGAHVLLAARRVDRLQELADRIVATGGRATPYGVDLTDPDAIDRLVVDVLADHGRVDVVVSNAGKSIRRSLTATEGRFHDVTRTDGVNYLGPVRLLSGLLPGMRARGVGHIVNVSSLNVDLPVAHWAAYSASKAAFESWLRCVAPEIRRDGVAVTSIHFPLVHTPMSAPTYSPRLPGLTAEAAAEVIARALVRRPRLLVPWWARPAAVVTTLAQGPYEALQSQVLRWSR